MIKHYNISYHDYINVVEQEVILMKYVYYKIGYCDYLAHGYCGYLHTYIHYYISFSVDMECNFLIIHLTAKCVSAECARE